MNKIVTGMMMSMGIAASMGAGYFLGLPKNKKKDLTDKARKIVTDNNMMKNS